MAERVFPKHFGDFKGLDLKNSDLSRGPTFAKMLRNCELTSQGDLKKRGGSKVAADSQPSQGLYSYQDTTLLMIGADLAYVTAAETTVGYLYKLSTGTLRITRAAGSTNCSWENLNLGDGSFQFRINQDGTPYFTTVYAGDFAFNNVTNMEFLRSSIEALANFNCAFPSNSSGKVNGNQAGVGSNANPLVLQAGHTVTANTWIELIDRRGGSTYKVQRYVTAVSGNNISWAITADAFSQLVDVNNNDVVGVGRYWLGVLPETPAVSFTDTADIKFPYWERVHWSPNLTADTPFNPGGYTSSGGSYFFNQIGPISHLEMQDCIYFTEGDNPSSLHTIKTEEITEADIKFVQYHKSLMKYDGLDHYQHGLPFCKITSAASAGAGTAVLNNTTVKYRATYQYQDFQGNTVESSTIKDVTFSNTSGGTVDVTLTVPCPNLASNEGAWNLRGAVVNGDQLGVTTITVTADHSLRAGHSIYFLDRSAGPSGTYITRTVTAVTRTTITIDGAVVDVGNTDPISNNFRTLLWRTKAGGNLFYLAKEVTTHPTTATQAILDVVTDANLGAQYLEPIDPFGRGTFPPMKYIAQHQGLLMGVNALEINIDNTAVSTLTSRRGGTCYFSDPENIEYYAAATNSFNVSSSPGELTGIISENNNSLCLFKKSAYYNVVGSVPDTTFELIEKTAGDIGCSSHATLKKLVLLEDEDTPNSSFIMGLGDTGFFSIRNGEISKTPGWFLDSEFLEADVFQTGKDYSTYSSSELGNLLQTQHALALNDRFHERYICVVPKFTNGAAATFSSSTKVYVFDYDNWGWFDWDYSSTVNPFRGMAALQDEVYFYSKSAGRLEYLFRYRDKYISTNLSYDYIDHKSAISQKYRPQWDTGGEPSVDKEWLRIKVYSFNPSLFVPNTLTIKTFRNWEDPDSANPDSSFTMAFSSSSIIELENKLRSNKARILLFEFSNVTVFESFLLTGYEYSVAIPYRMQDVKKT